METVIITTADGDEFKIELHYLTAGCKVFRDMFSIQGAKRSKEPILIDEPTEVVEIFLSMLRNEYEMDYENPFYESIAEGLCGLAEMYDSPTIKANMRSCLSWGSYEIRPWELLLMACRVDGERMAEHALGCMDPDEITVDKIWDSSLSDEWKKTLLQAIQDTWRRRKNPDGEVLGSQFGEAIRANRKKQKNKQ